jgi:hypothetical protein
MRIIESKILNRFSNIQFGFSTKIGLGRKAPYYFNISKSVGDDEAAVESNRRAFAAALNINPDHIAYQKQIHSDIIKIIDKPGPAGECDAMITDKKNLFLAATSADCPTIYIYDKSKNVIAAVHSGWRGTARKILYKTVMKIKNDFKSHPVDLFVFLAPAICQDNYEIGKELVDQFDARYVKLLDGRFYLDLIAANRDMLVEQGVPEENIEISRFCSFQESDLLHSYRREGKKSGRAFGIIGMNS